MSDIPRETTPPEAPPPEPFEAASDSPSEVPPAEPFDAAPEAPVEAPPLEPLEEVPEDEATEASGRPESDWTVDDDIAAAVAAYRDDGDEMRAGQGAAVEAFNDAAPVEASGGQGSLRDEFNAVAEPGGDTDGDGTDGDDGKNGDGGDEQAKLEHERKDWNPPPHLRTPRFTP